MADGALDAGTLFRRHAPFVAAFLARLGVEGQDLDDLTQEVFLTAHRKGGFRPGPARPTTWLAEIAVRIVSTSRRARRRRPADPAGPDADRALGGLPATTTGPAEAVEARESWERVRRALEGLDLDHRAAFVLFEIEGESCDAIAAGLGIPIGTVYSRLHAARRGFERAYAKLSAREESRVGALQEVGS